MLRHLHSILHPSYFPFSTTPTCVRCRYKDAHGHCYVPHRYHDAPFAEWIHRQRTTYASSSSINPSDPSSSQPSSSCEADLTIKNNRMHQQRIHLLQSIGFHFTVHSNKWMDHYEELKGYKDQHGVSESSDFHTH